MSERSCAIQKILALHFLLNSVKALGIDLLHRLGLSAHFTTVDEVENGLGVESSKRLKRIGKNGNGVPAYDNFEQMERVKEQNFDNSQHFHSVTKGIVAEGVSMPEGGLGSQIGELKSVSGTEFIKDAERTIATERSIEIRRVFIHWALQEAFPEAYEEKFGAKPELPTIDRLEPRKTISSPIDAIMEDGSTIEGNAEILKNIFCTQLKLPPRAFRDKLLVNGDMKTIHLIRRVKDKMDGFNDTDDNEEHHHSVR